MCTWCHEEFTFLPTIWVNQIVCGAASCRHKVKILLVQWENIASLYVSAPYLPELRSLWRHQFPMSLWAQKPGCGSAAQWEPAAVPQSRTVSAVPARARPYCSHQGAAQRGGRHRRTRGGCCSYNWLDALVPFCDGSPELNGIEQIHLCGFGPAHNVSQRHQGAGVELARTLLGGV